ncbi:unnamed protein product [Pseudo-nitzschia multistriata]|uniref:Uncharacterized protein n=1 Tax=Pseudo-nitzschia multistriata TaxID=183589 RepID=A0A448ZNR5_9STRA|nr:unnamed protein product [Pseudo-nitzschia multistriata]
MRRRDRRKNRNKKFVDDGNISNAAVLTESDDGFMGTTQPESATPTATPTNNKDTRKKVNESSTKDKMKRRKRIRSRNLQKKESAVKRVFDGDIYYKDNNPTPVVPGSESRWLSSSSWIGSISSWASSKLTSMQAPATTNTRSQYL